MQARPRTMRSMRLWHLLSWSFFYEESINYSRFVIHMQFFLQRLLEDLLQKEITEEERVYLIVHISRTTQKQ